MRILVIGGTGFIGPHLVRQLDDRGHSVAVFHRGNAQVDLPAEHILGDPVLPGAVGGLPVIYALGAGLGRLSPTVRRAAVGRRGFLFEENVARGGPPRGYVEKAAGARALAAVSEQAAGRVYNVAER